MAQMPASYLEEKIGAIDNTWSVVDRQNGTIDLTDQARRRLADIALHAQAIIDEINQWAGIEVRS